MQVSIYIPDELTKKIDQGSKKRGWSRSKLITTVLEEALSGKKMDSIFAPVFGILNEKTADTMLASIYNDRKNSTRFR